MDKAKMTKRELGTVVVFVVLVASPIVFGIFGKVAEAGVTVLAASLALAFLNLDRLKKFKGAGFEAEMRDQLDAIVAAESEPEEEPTPGGFEVESYGIDENSEKVMSALNSSHYTWRSVGGIAKETGLTRPNVVKSLEWLESVGLALKIGTRRKVNWGLSEKGREVALFL